MATVSKAKEH